MRQYHKIDSVYKRNPEDLKHFIDGEWSNPAFGYLATNEWVFTEKVDGTNIRVKIHKDGAIEFGGKSDNAQIPAKLVLKLQNTFMPLDKKLAEMFPNGACLYGEGYGATIQKGGGNYRQDQGFVLFDVWIPSEDNERGWWLERPNVLDIAAVLDLEIVPIIGTGTLSQMIESAKTGFNSTWGNFKAEGIVARPKTELCDRAGRRIITKVKHKDFVTEK